MVKIRNRLDPYSTAAALRAYVYDSVILVWETKKESAITSEGFSCKDSGGHLKLQLKAFKKLTELEAAETNQDPNGDFLHFYYKSPLAISLFKSLRDTFAHGHFSSGKANELILNHKFQGPRDKKSKVRLYGRVKVSTLKKLIEILAPSGKGD